MWEIRTIDEFTPDFSGNYRIETEWDFVGGVKSIPAPGDHIRLIDKNMELGTEAYYITMEQLMGIVDKGRRKTIELTPLSLREPQAWLYITPQQAMSLGCKWMNYKLKHRRGGNR